MPSTTDNPPADMSMDTGPQSVTVTGEILSPGPVAMAENWSPSTGPPTTESEHRARRAEKRCASTSTVSDSKVELSNRAKLAATDWYTSRGTDLDHHEMGFALHASTA
jgi:hypothetical protein